MGEVYRARDSKLKRDVAIKVLPDDVANDPERLARFQREAEVLASLNHPNIAHVYGIEARALVMELVEGDDLAQVIARGPIPIDEALPIARQIVEALEAAHDAGIIHRDLKPANVKVRPDGTVKVLDFGLAKALDPGTGIREPGSGRDPANSPTITSPAMTVRGMILGTAAYMSPEQARGKFVDKRADIWAFGCVLYEMLTGRRAFRGEDATDTIAEVLKASVNMAAVPADTPARVVALINNCLQRDPKMRLRDIGDARLALTDHGANEDRLAMAGRAVRTREIVAWLLVAVLAVAAAILAFRPAAAPQLPDPVRFTLEVASDPSAFGVIAAMSPDGRTLALQPNGPGDGLLLRRLDAEEFGRLEGTTGARAFAWSPDSRSLAFVSGSQVKVVDLDGSVRSLARTPEGAAGTALAWGATGTILIAFTAAPLHVLRPETSRLEAIGPLDLATGEREQAAPVFHPDGRRFFYLSLRNQVTPLVTRFRSLDSGPIQELSSEDRILWAGEEHVVFRRGATLMAQRIGYAPLALQVRRCNWPATSNNRPKAGSPMAPFRRAHLRFATAPQAGNSSPGSAARARSPHASDPKGSIQRSRSPRMVPASLCRAASRMVRASGSWMPRRAR